VLPVGPAYVPSVMRTIRTGRSLALAALVLAVVGPLTAARAYVPPGVNTLVSKSILTGKPPLLGMSGGSRISRDGRYVVYASDAADIVLGDTNAASDVFEWDRLTGKTVRVSVGSKGIQAVGPTAPVGRGSEVGAVSANGRYVVFISDAVNLVPKDTNGVADVFVHDRINGWTKRVSVSSSGAQANGASGGQWAVDISADGRYVAFNSLASNLVTGDTNGYDDVFVHDMATGQTKRVSDNDVGAGRGPDITVDGVAISGNGRYVAYSAPSSLPDRVVGESDVWVRDLKTGAKRRGNVTTGGGVPLLPAPLASGAITTAGGLSFDGRYVLFLSSDAYVPNKTTTMNTGLPAQPASELYRHDFRTGQTERVSVNSSGEERDNGTGIPAGITSDGRFVVFTSHADFTSPSRTQCADLYGLCFSSVYVRDMDLGTTVLETWTYDGKPAARGWAQAAFGESISDSGRYTVQVADDGDMVKGQHGSNSWATYLRDMGLVRGVGSLVQSGRLSVTGTPAFARTGLASRSDPTDDVGAALTTLGGNLSGATVAYRQASGDLLFRLAVVQMPSYATADPLLVYAWQFTAGANRYELRIAKAATAPSFELYRSSTSGWQEVAALHGGYGTTGAEVVAAVPLSVLGMGNGGHLSDLVASVGTGTTGTGITSLVDQVRL
jgi:Tol biopolymer transport system component